MKVLIVGNPYSIFVQKLVDELKTNFSDIIIDVLTYENIDKMPQFKADNIFYYNTASYENKVKVIITKVKKFLYIRKLLISAKDYSIINIHFIFPTNALFWNYIKKNSAKKIISIWGSDYYRASEKLRKKFGRMFSSCDVITFTNEITRDDFVSYYGRFKDKSSVIRFGLDTLPYIDQYRGYTKTRLLSDMKYPEKEIYILCAYSASIYHQHEKIINSINLLSNEYKKRGLFIFPMTYGGENYRDDIEKMLSTCNFEYVVLKNYMTTEQVAKLRLLSDILIFIPVSDQFSGSMQETIYAGNVAITGEWLPYKTLDDHDVFLLKAKDSLNSVADTLAYAIDNLPDLKKKVQKNSRIIWELSSWENNIKKWHDLYSSIL